MNRQLTVPSDLESLQQLPYLERLRLHALMREQQSHHLATLVALRLTDGTSRWQQIFEWEQESYLSLVEGIASGERVFLTVSHQHSQPVATESADLIAVLSENGLPLWQRHVADTICEAPLIVNGILYLGADDGHVYALRTDTGDLLWRIPITVSD